MIELKPCPFCGGQAAYYETAEDSVECLVCEAKAKSPVAWNLRRCDLLEEYAEKLSRMEMSVVGVCEMAIQQAGMWDDFKAFADEHAGDPVQ